MSFYESKGKDLAREKGGIDKERVMQDAAFRRTRENMAEFGGSAVVGKALRTGLAAVKRFGNYTLVARIVKAMKGVNSNGQGQRGKRDFAVTASPDALLGFEFNPTTVLGSMFSAGYTLAPNAARNEVVLTVPNFDTDAFVHAPAGATHFRLVCAVATLSNYAYSNATGKYEPTNEAENGLGAVQMSGELALGGMVGATTTLTVQVPGVSTLPATVALVACVGIEYVQQLNNQYYLLASGTAMRIAGVF